ncbi:flavin monoamine oxidase family protein [Labrys monachus]|uniref:Tryptophan 2-monooxygenase n=1 Tax=Labrys monachus TaxID=217067 RepID=A0ABU0FBE1_9HYPH|nr:NAD(P)/FAD-dependent oxidoreductase [Labrys monachus]MDQ0391439.1 monoamine oxidase [Labrys monachus]
MTSPSLPTIVIGAGAAGLAAARALIDAGVDTLVLEARARIGGRAWTVRHAGMPLDLGCGWLHSADRNPFRAIAEQQGFTLDPTAPTWDRQYGNLGFSQSDQAAFHRASEAFYARIEAAAAGNADAPASDYLEPGNRWNGLLDAVSTYINGVEFDRLSVVDYARYADTGVNWRVREGYGALIAAYGRDVPTRLDCHVRLVDHGGRDVRLETSQGVVVAQTVIVTVPPTLLATESIRFSPALPRKLGAAHNIALGVADKLLLAVEDPASLPRDAHLFGRTDRVGTGGYSLQPLGRPVIEGYFGGELAKALEQGGLPAFTAFALEELEGLFGADVLKGLSPIAATAWHGDPHSLGSYSQALPGHADERALLAEPIPERLYFAGEACSRHDFSTAHGAYRTGVAAAEALLADRSRSAASA